MVERNSKIFHSICAIQAIQNVKFFELIFIKTFMDHRLHTELFGCHALHMVASN